MSNYTHSLLTCSGRLVSKTKLNSGGGVKNRGRLGSGRVIKLNSTGPKPLWFFVPFTISLRFIN